MKTKVATLLILSSMSLSAYEGCGSTQNEALSELSNTIHVKVDDNFKQKVKTSNSKVLTSLESFNEDISTSLNVSSFSELQGVVFTNRNNQKCAILSDINLQKSVQNTLKQLHSFSIDALLNKTVKQRAKTIEEQLKKIEFVKAVLKNATQNDLNFLEQLQNQLEEAVDIAIVTFHVNSPYAKIKISGLKHTYTPSQKIVLKADKYSYEVYTSSHEFCPIKGEFEVKKMQIKNEDIKLEKFPTITFSSNKSDVDVHLQGKKVALDTTIVIDQCKGNKSWSMDYRGDKVDGIFNLFAGTNEKINENFLSTQERKEIKTKLTNYSSQRELNINYGYAISDDSHWDQNDRIEVKYFKNLHTYKYGYGLNIGSQKNWASDNINEVEFTLNGRIQIVDELNGKLLHIDNVALVPYVGVSTGVEVKEETVALFRFEAGATFLFTKDLGLNLNTSYDILDKEDFIVSTGLVFSFPLKGHESSWY